MVTRNKYPLIVIFALLFSFFSCSEEPSQIISYTDIENAFKEIEVSPGIKDVSLQITTDVVYNFRVIFPNVDLTNDLPLVLALHWASADPNAHKETDCYVEEGLASLNAIIISPNGDDENWGTLSNQDKLRILVDLSTRLWNVDLAKILVTGYSSGGNGSWFYAETQPSVFSAAIAMAAGYNTLRPDGLARKIDIPLYHIHGENDDFFPLDTVQYWVEQTQLVGSDIEFVVADSLGHYQPCEYVPYLQDAAEWLLNEVWQ